ncbi:MAG: gliding motility-associated C-terminal domain-containing protein [Bacteroidia bacterium]
MKKIKQLLLSLFITTLPLIFNPANAQCTWHQTWFEGFEYSTVIPGVQTGVSYQNSPANWAAHTGATSMYLNFVNGLAAGTLVYQNTISVCPAEQTRVSAWLTTTFAGTQCDMQMEIRDANNVVLTNTSSILCPYSPTWTQYISPAFIPGTATITINLYTNVAGNPGGNDLSVDDFLVEQCFTSDTLTINYGNICSNAAAIDLFNLLTTNPPNTGTWSGPGNLTGGYLGTFDPAVNSGGSYIYNTFTSNCTNDTDYVVVINVTQPPSLTSSHTNATAGNNGTATVVATGNGPFNYLWSDGSTNATATGLAPGTYTVIVTDSNGCTSTTSETILFGNSCTWHSLLADSYEYTTVCPDIIPGTTYQNSPASWAAHSGTYSLYLNFVDSNIAGGTVAGTKVYERTIDVCPNFPTQISLWLTTTFAGIQCDMHLQITDANGVILADTSSIAAPYAPQWYQYQSGSFVPATSTIQFRMFTNVGGGGGNDLSMDDFLVEHCYTDPNSVSINYGGICQNASTVDFYNLLTDTPTTVGSWTGPSNLTGGYIGTFNPTSNLSGTYIYTSSPFGTDSVCPIAHDTVSVAVNALPTVLIAVTNSICGNSNGTANVDTNAIGTVPPYQFLWSNGQTTSQSNGLGQGFYTVTVTDANGCSKIDSVTVGNTTSTILLQLSSTNSTCTQSNGTASAIPNGGTAPYSYQWSNGSTVASVSGLFSGTYTVTVTDVNGCTKIDTVNVGNNPSTVQLQLFSTYTTCSLNDGTASVTPGGGTAPYTYQWSSGSTVASLSGLATGSYTVTVTDVNGCTRVDSIYIGNNPSTVQLQTTSTGTTCGQSNGSATVSPNGGTSPYSYQWSSGSSISVLSGLSPGTYTITVTDVNGCTAIDTITANPSSAFILSVSSDTIICAGESTSISANAPAATSYSWSPSTGLSSSSTANPLATPGSTTTYIVTASDGICTSVDSILVTVSPLPVAAYTIAPQQGAAPLDVTFINNTSGSNSYTWNFGDTTFSSLPNDSHTYPLAGTYNGSLIVTNSNNCSDTLLFTIIVEDSLSLIIPNVFTPNGDNFNDVWKFKEQGIESISVLIYNRWGNRVFDWNQLNGSWNGKTTNGDLAPEGTYFYIVKAKSKGSGEKTFDYHGAVTLLREKK